MNDKKRAPNFSSKEESLLVLLVKKYKDLLECQQTDTKSNASKAEAWKKIEDEFNGTSGDAFRPKDVLRKKYENIKKRTKKKFAEEKNYARGTGGGPPQKKCFTDVDNTIKEILGTKIEGLFSEFDDDAEISISKNEIIEVPDPNTIIQIEEIEKNSIEIVEVEDSLSENIIVDQQSGSKTSSEARDTNNWAKYNPNMLKRPKTQGLQPNKREKLLVENFKIRDKVSQWAEAKSILEISKNNFLEKEHELKLKHMEEKHQLELELLRKKHELEMKLMKEESKAKIECLQKNKIK